MAWIHLLLIVFIGYTLPVNSDVNVITKHCKESWCNSLDVDDPRYTSRDYNKKLIQFFSAGITQLIYEDASVTASNSKLSSQCSSSLKKVSQALLKGEEWAFRLIDSSSKTPNAFMAGVVSSLGDYDQCLSITKDSLSPVDGKYCLVDIFPLDYKNVSKKQGQMKDKSRVSLIKMRHFRDSAYYFSICLPSECSEQDTRSLFKSVLKDLPLAVEGYISCDTNESISWSSRLYNLRPISIAGIIYLSLIIGLVVYGTICHIIQPKPSALCVGVSAIENVHLLFWVKSSNRRQLILPYVKLFCIVAGLVAHVMCCLESAIGFMMMSHHSRIGHLLSDPLMVTLFGDAGIVFSTSIAGFTLFMLAYPMAEKGKMSIVMFILNKALRFIPSILAIMSIDVIWYLPLSGPFVTRVGKVIVDKCTQTWWQSALFVNNLWTDALQICSGHTYSLSVDVQLSIFGLIGIVLLARKPIIGFIYCIAIAIGGCCMTFYYAYKYNVQPNLMVANSPSIEDIESFLTYIHMATSSYVPSYFISILIGYIIYNGLWSKIRSNFLLVSVVTCIAGAIAQHFPFLSNVLQIVTPEWTPYFIVFNRFIVVIETTFAFFLISHFDNATREPVEERSNLKVDQIDSKTNDEDGSYSFFKGVLRSTFAIYMVNYTFIRADFFTSRNMLYTSVYCLVKRATTSFVMILPLAFAFHVIIVAPTFNLVTLLMTPNLTKSKSRGKTE